MDATGHVITPWFRCEDTGKGGCRSFGGMGVAFALQSPILPLEPLVRRLGCPRPGYGTSIPGVLLKVALMAQPNPSLSGLGMRTPSLHRAQGPGNKTRHPGHV